MADLEQVKHHIWNRAFRIAASQDFPDPLQFTQIDTSIAYYAHQALQCLVSSYIYYELGGRDGWSVYSVTEPALWHADLANVRLDWIPCLDYGEMGVVAETLEGAVCIHRATRSVIAIDRLDRRVAIISTDQVGGFVDSYKVIRQLLTEMALAYGAVPVRASAVAHSGRVIGFTSSYAPDRALALLHAVSGRVVGLDYCSADRLLLEKTGDGIVAHGWPTVAGFRADALARLTGIDAVLSPRFHLSAGGIAYLLSDLPLIAAFGTGQARRMPRKIRLTPSEMQTLFGTPLAACGELSILVDIASTSTKGRTIITEIVDPIDISGVFRRHFEDSLINHPSWLRASVVPSAERVIENKETWSTLPHHGLRVFGAQPGYDWAEVVRGLCAIAAGPKSHGIWPRWHFGVYGVVAAGDGILTIRDLDGPDPGVFTLPGGQVKVGESADEALSRLVFEQLGRDVSVMGMWRQFQVETLPPDDGSAAVRQIFAGQWRFVGIVTPTGSPANTSCRQFSWIPLTGWQDRTDLSPYLIAIMAVLPEYLASTGLLPMFHAQRPDPY